MPDPAVPVCLTTPYSAKPGQKGGTLIAEEVATLEEHHRRLVDPDGYRPPCCCHCGFSGLHAHDFRERVLRGDSRWPVERIRRYLCPCCQAVWQVLPGFIARHLHRSWRTVQAATSANGDVVPAGTERRVSVPVRTVRRWSGRLQAMAVQLYQVLTCVGEGVAEVVGRVGAGCSRAVLVDTLAASGLVEPAAKLDQVAGWVHRLVPGLRLM